MRTASWQADANRTESRIESDRKQRCVSRRSEKSEEEEEEEKRKIMNERGEVWAGFSGVVVVFGEAFLGSAAPSPALPLSCSLAPSLSR